jgi:hypothetical protein
MSYMLIREENHERVALQKQQVSHLASPIACHSQLDWESRILACHQLFLDSRFHGNDILNQHSPFLDSRFHENDTPLPFLSFPA